MRGRVETGLGTFFVSALAFVASGFWYLQTSAPSLWWGISGVLSVGSAIGVARGLQLMLSGLPGFGRNFLEEREPPDPPPGDEAYDHDAALSSEASHVWAGPLALFVSGVLATAFRLFPAMMTPDGVPDPDFIPSHMLVLWIFFAGFATIGWTVVVLVMMKTGPDRWTYVSGARERIRSSMWILLILGVILVTIATAFTINSETDPVEGGVRTSAESLHV